MSPSTASLNNFFERYFEREVAQKHAPTEISSASEGAEAGSNGLSLKLKISNSEIWEFEMLKSEMQKIENFEIWKYEHLKIEHLKIWNLKFENLKIWAAILSASVAQKRAQPVALSASVAQEHARRATLSAWLKSTLEEPPWAPLWLWSALEQWSRGGQVAPVRQLLCSF